MRRPPLHHLYVPRHDRAASANYRDQRAGVGPQALLSLYLVSPRYSFSFLRQNLFFDGDRWIRLLQFDNALAGETIALLPISTSTLPFEVDEVAAGNKWSQGLEEGFLV